MGRAEAETAIALYGTQILHLAYSYLHNQADAEDVLQDAMVQLICRAPDFESPEHTRAWLLRVATANPVLTLDSLEALGEAAPFPLSVPSQLPQGYVPEGYALLGGALAEVRYSDGTDTITFRMAEGTEDVSGDFQTYAWQEEREGVTLKGEAGQVFLALWQEGAFRCSLAFSAGVTPEEALEAAQSLEPV